MPQPNAWTPAEAHSTAALLHSLPQPLTALADGDVPAVVLTRMLTHPTTAAP